MVFCQFQNKVAIAHTLAIKLEKYVCVVILNENSKKKNVSLREILFSLGRIPLTGPNLG